MGKNIFPVDTGLLLKTVELQCSLPVYICSDKKKIKTKNQNPKPTKIPAKQNKINTTRAWVLTLHLVYLAY